MESGSRGALTRRWIIAAQILGVHLAIAAPTERMLFSYFRDNGKDGVFLATTEDGREFKALNDDKPIFTPPKWRGQNLTRDPSILYHDGIFHMVWTSNWTGRIFGYASSRNLADWSEPVQVRPFPDSLPKEDQPDNVWAPEIHHDPVKNDFFILFASTTPRERNDDDASNNNGKPGFRYDNRVFITRTKDFKTFSEARLYFDRGFASIDAVMKPDPARKNWVMIIKCSRDESLKTMPGRNLWLTRSSGMDSDKPDFAPLTAPIAGNHSPMFEDPSPRKSMAEGPSLLRHGELWWLVWDEPAGGHLQLATSPDLKAWTHHKGAKFPPRAQHGTLFLAPGSAVSWSR
ncbi:MAG: hypothetical protein RLZ97_683 [Verrucomicrobiota bacterium]|jgi:hypothetical protein